MIFRNALPVMPIMAAEIDLAILGRACMYIKRTNREVPPINSNPLGLKVPLPLLSTSQNLPFNTPIPIIVGIPVVMGWIIRVVDRTLRLC